MKINLLVKKIKHSEFRFDLLLKLLITIALVISLFIPISSVQAQNDLPDGPVYLVQEGDTLWDIALRFGVAVEDLEDLNGITDSAQIAVGTQLVIPGLEGILGLLETQTISYGETLRSLSRRYRLPEGTLVRLNHFTSSKNIYPGATLVVSFTK